MFSHYATSLKPHYHFRQHHKNYSETRYRNYISPANFAIASVFHSIRFSLVVIQHKFVWILVFYWMTICYCIDKFAKALHWLWRLRCTGKTYNAVWLRCTGKTYNAVWLRCTGKTYNAVWLSCTGKTYTAVWLRSTYIQ